ncbi:hypothetical protein M3I54_29830 [Paraburkholderia sp. CNPSo 3274]|uniref:hypothetical protein n=1 Tax=Paraburkholderia sp. CNPSo 3274 TaxID=2940932 RepID=UPI0020B875D6|nr:hypothetical protein [Paraburkholderia sp. CNPSo 3274]MCP3711127.1 hypothetical protein [Paraburkholderia sp. CNPSo 3274]
MCAICNFKLEFGIGHPFALSVAVASRHAIEAGLIEPIDTAEGALSAARKRMSAVDALNLPQARIESGHAVDDLLALPDFYVLLIENDTWGFFHATTEGFDPDIVPEMPDVTTTDEARRSNVVITSEAALRAWLSGRFDMSRAFDASLILIDAPDAAVALLKRMLSTADSVATVSQVVAQNQRQAVGQNQLELPVPDL